MHARTNTCPNTRTWQVNFQTFGRKGSHETNDPRGIGNIHKSTRSRERIVIHPRDIDIAVWTNLGRSQKTKVEHAAIVKIKHLIHFNKCVSIGGGSKFMSRGGQASDHTGFSCKGNVF